MAVFFFFQILTLILAYFIGTKFDSFFEKLLKPYNIPLKKVGVIFLFFFLSYVPLFFLVKPIFFHTLPFFQNLEDSFDSHAFSKAINFGRDFLFELPFLALTSIIWIQPVLALKAQQKKTMAFVLLMLTFIVLATIFQFFTLFFTTLALSPCDLDGVCL